MLLHLRTFAEALFSTEAGPPPAARMDWLMKETKDYLQRAGTWRAVSGPFDVRPLEVRSFEEQRENRVPGGRIRHAITQVESGGMSPLAEPAVGVASPTQMFGIEGRDVRRDARDQAIQPIARLKAASPLGSNGGLEQSRGRDDLAAGGREALSEGRGVFFAEHDGQQG